MPTAGIEFGSGSSTPPPAQEPPSQKSYKEQWDEILRKYGSTPKSFPKSEKQATSRPVEGRSYKPIRGFSKKMVKYFLARKAVESQRNESNPGGKVPQAPKGDLG